MKPVFLILGWLFILGSVFCGNVQTEKNEHKLTGEQGYISTDQHQPLDAIETLTVVFTSSTFSNQQNTGKSNHWKLAARQLVNTLKNQHSPFEQFFTSQKSTNLFLLKCCSWSLLSVMRC